MLSAFGIVIVAATVYDLLTSPSLQQPDDSDSAVISAVTCDEGETEDSERSPVFDAERDVPLIAVTPTFALRRKRVLCMLFTFQCSVAI